MSLPANLASLKDSIQQTRSFISNNGGGGGSQYIKMGKDGVWVMGSDENEVDLNGEWAVNPTSIMTGWIAFDKNGDRMGEEMAPMSEPPLPKSSLPDVGAEWKPQISFSAACITGSDVGTQAIFNLKSNGGMQAGNKLTAAIFDRILADNPECVAIVTLGNTSYKHSNPSFGKIYKPIFTIEDWTTMDATEAPAKAPAIEEDDSPEPQRRRRRAQ